jgi:hypothetical protein
MEVEDTELYDFVEDYLVEKCDIEPEGVTSLDRGALCVHTMSFCKDISIQALHEALLDLDPREVERIFKLNNPWVEKENSEQPPATYLLKAALSAKCWGEALA